MEDSRRTRPELTPKIIVGLDGSPAAAAAMCWASRLAGVNGAEVVVVHVVEPPPSDVRPLNLPRAILNEGSWCEALAAEVEGAWCAPLAHAGIRHRVRIVEGSAGPRLTEVAAEERAVLLVAGRGAEAGLAELVHGGVMAYLIHHAPCPVAVIPAERRAPESPAHSRPRPAHAGDHDVEDEEAGLGRAARRALDTGRVR